MNEVSKQSKRASRAERAREFVSLLLISNKVHGLNKCTKKHTCQKLAHKIRSETYVIQCVH